MLTIILAFLPTLFCHSAFEDSWEVDFSDMNWATASNWWGDRSNFAINTEDQLLLADPTPESNNFARVFSRQLVDASHPLSWSLDLVFPFNPSTANHVTLGLYTALPQTAIDNPDGYYLQIGGQSGTDFIELFAREGQQNTSISKLEMSWLAQETYPLSLFVSFHSGQWQLQVCLPDGTCYIGAPSFFPLDTSNKGYFSLNCHYTISRNNAILFDNIAITGIIPDREAPILEAILPEDSLRLGLHFSEPLSSAPVINTTLDAPEIAALQWSSSQPAYLQIHLATPLLFNRSYRLHFPTVADAFGNNTSIDTLLFFREPYLAIPGEIVFSEIMADPNPPKGLPNTEYLEIFNHQTETVLLENFALQVNQKVFGLPDLSLAGKKYLTFSREAVHDKVENGVILPDLPIIPNNGCYLALLQNGSVIDALNWDISWYGSKVPEGGVSLEKAAIHQTGNCPLNWKPSLSVSGGTPSEPGQTSPFSQSDRLFFVEMLYLREDGALEIDFSQAIETGTFLSRPPFYSSPDLPILATELASEKKVVLHYEMPPDTSTIYELFPAATLQNCIGAPLQQFENLYFSTPRKPTRGMLFLNEILFDPSPGQVPFIEVYNASPYYLDLSKMLLRAHDPEKGIYIDAGIARNTMLAPDSFLVLTPDRETLQQAYPATPVYNCLNTALPAFNRNRGSLSLWLGGELIDSIVFDAAWHHPFLSGVRGISLEKTASALSGLEAKNWHSGTSESNYASPGLANAILREGKSYVAKKKTDMIRISPDGDGVDDYLAVYLEPRVVNNLCNAAIFTLHGRPVRRLANRQVISSGFNLRWDGEDEQGQRVGNGIYVLRIELFSPQGGQEIIKKACLLW